MYSIASQFMIMFAHACNQLSTPVTLSIQQTMLPQLSKNVCVSHTVYELEVTELHEKVNPDYFFVIGQSLYSELNWGSQLKC